MSSLNYRKLIQIRIDPDMDVAIPTGEQLFRTLVLNPELFSDRFLLEVSPPENVEPAIISCVNAICTDIITILEANGEISTDQLVNARNHWLSEYKLKPATLDKPEIRKYEAFLLEAAGDKPLVSSETFESTERLAKVLREVMTIPTIKNFGASKSMLSNYSPILEIYRSEGGPSYLLDQQLTVNKRFTYTRFNLKDTFDLLTICNDKEVRVDNIFKCERIIDFPEIYVKEHLKYRTGLQHMILKDLGYENIKIFYQVVSNKKQVYEFEIKTIMDLTEDLNMCRWHSEHGAYGLPYEYLHDPYTI